MESLESYKINLIVGPPQSFYPPQFQFASLPQQRKIRTSRGKGLKNDTMLHTPHSPLIILLFYHCWHFWFVSSLWTFYRVELNLGSKFFFSMYHEFWQKIMIHDFLLIYSRTSSPDPDRMSVSYVYYYFILYCHCSFTLLSGQNDENHYFGIFPLSS